MSLGSHSIRILLSHRTHGKITVTRSVPYSILKRTFLATIYSHQISDVGNNTINAVAALQAHSMLRLYTGCLIHIHVSVNRSFNSIISQPTEFICLYGYSADSSVSMIWSSFRKALLRFSSGLHLKSRNSTIVIQPRTYAALKSQEPTLSCMIRRFLGLC